MKYSYSLSINVACRSSNRSISKFKSWRVQVHILACASSYPTAVHQFILWPSITLKEQTRNKMFGFQSFISVSERVLVDVHIMEAENRMIMLASRKQKTESHAYTMKAWNRMAQTQVGVQT